MKRIESELEKKCCNYARKLGMAAVKLEKNGNKGIPDRLFIKNGGDVLFVEFKKNDMCSPSKEQLFWLNFIGEKQSCIISSFEQLINLQFFVKK